MAKLKPVVAPFAWFERGAYASSKARDYLQHEFEPQKIKKIAVIRHAALGDQVITRPFLIELKKFFPNAHITFVGVSNYQYATPSDLVDRVHFLHGKDKKDTITFKEKIENIKQIGKQDIIFDVAGTNRSYWVMALVKARLKVGFPHKTYLRGLLYNVAVSRSDFQAEVEVMLDMLRLFGHCPPVRLDFGLADHKLLKSKDIPYVVYFNSCSQPRRVLPQEQCLKLLEQGALQFPYLKHVYLEGLGASEKADFIKPLLNKKNILVAPSMPLDDLTEYLAKASLVVSVDTGILNLAVATHTPTVGLFYSTNPYRVMPRYEPYHYIVMNADTSIPSNEQILNKMKEVLALSYDF